METLGFIEVQPGRGAVVREPSGRLEDSPRWRFKGRFSEADVFQFRLLIETFTARLAATTITAEQIIELYRNVEAMKASIRASDLEASARIDAAFHASIIAWSGNNLLAEIYTTTEGIIVESHRLPLLARHRLWEQPINEHVNVLKAFEQHDPEGAGYYMRLHLVRTAGRSGVGTRLDNI